MMRYTAMTLATFFLVACGGGSSGGSGDITLSLLGKVQLRTDITGATVTATAGEKTVTAQVQSDGSFLLQALSAKVTDFVTISGKGPAGQEFIDLQSLTGTIGSLQSKGMAGRKQQPNDALLVSSDDEPRLILDAISTARASIIARQAVTTPVLDDAALEAAENALDQDSVFNLATTIELVADQTVALPDNVADIATLLADATQTDNFVETAAVIQPEAFTSTRADLQQNAPLVATAAGFTAELLLDDEWLGWQVTNGIQDLRELEFSADGTGQSVSQLFLSDETNIDTFSWDIDDSQRLLRLRYDKTQTTISSFVEDQGGQQVNVIETCVSSNRVDTLRFISAVANEVLVLLEENLDERCVDQNDNVRSDEPGATFSYNLNLLRRSAVAAIPGNFVGSDFAYLTTTVESQAQFGGVAEVFLNQGANTFSGELHGQSYQVTTEAGEVLIADGRGSAAATRIHGVLRQYNDVALAAYGSYVAPDNTRLPTAHLLVRAQPRHVFTADNIPGIYFDNGVGDQLGGTFGGDFRLRLEVDGSGAQESIFPPEPDFSSPFAWALEGNLVAVRRGFFDGSMGRVDDLCGTDIFASDCVQFDNRRLIPVAVTGTEHYWVEHRTFGPDDDPNAPTTFLLRHWSKRPLDFIGPVQDPPYTPPPPQKSGVRSSAPGATAWHQVPKAQLRRN